MTSACVMLTKCPTEGVKTRLAQAIGEKRSARIHTALTLYMAQVIQDSGLPFYVSFKGDTSSPLAVRLRAYGAQIFPQSEGSLGDRIHHAFSVAERCVIVGSDCPWITSRQLQEALAQQEIVIGPAEDGGYYLMAASRPPKALFEDISWSTVQVLRQTLHKCRVMSYPVIQHDVQYDIDNIHDLHRAIHSQNLPPILHTRLISHA